MLNKNEQMIDAIWTDEDLKKISQELYDAEYKDSIVVDSPFGKQYFNYLSRVQREKKSTNNILIKGGVYSSGQQ